MNQSDASKRQLDFAARHISPEKISELLSSSRLSKLEFSEQLSVSLDELAFFLDGDKIPSAYLAAKMRSLARRGLTDGRGWETASQVAARAQYAINDNDNNWAFRILIEGRDNLRNRTADERIIWGNENPNMSDSNWMTFFAAIIAKQYSDNSWTDVPHWAQNLTPLKENWSPLPRILSKSQYEPFYKLNIDLSERDLVTL